MADITPEAIEEKAMDIFSISRSKPIARIKVWWPSAPENIKEQFRIMARRELDVTAHRERELSAVKSKYAYSSDDPQPYIVPKRKDGYNEFYFDEDD